MIQPDILSMVLKLIYNFLIMNAKQKKKHCYLQTRWLFKEKTKFARSVLTQTVFLLILQTQVFFYLIIIIPINSRISSTISCPTGPYATGNKNISVLKIMIPSKGI